MFYHRALARSTFLFCFITLRLGEDLEMDFPCLPVQSVTKNLQSSESISAYEKARPGLSV